MNFYTQEQKVLCSLSTITVMIIGEEGMDASCSIYGGGEKYTKD
jgi:hypothetical protein